MTDDLLQALSHRPLHRFSDWPNTHIPPVVAGVYTIWDGDRLVYVGMAGRSLTPDTIASYRTDPLRRTGLASRLSSHASGRRSGDQFCVYVCDRLVLPTLTRRQISEIAHGRLSLDSLVRQYIHDRLSYRLTETYRQADRAGHTRRSTRGRETAAKPPRAASGQHERQVASLRHRGDVHAGDDAKQRRRPRTSAALATLLTTRPVSRPGCCSTPARKWLESSAGGGSRTLMPHEGTPDFKSGAFAQFRHPGVPKA